MVTIHKEFERIQLFNNLEIYNKIIVNDKSTNNLAKGSFIY